VVDYSPRRQPAAQSANLGNRSQSRRRWFSLTGYPMKQQPEYDWFKAEQLHFAAMKGDVEKCVQLIAEGYDPNGFDQIGNTPLHYAAEKEQFDAVEALISHGAKVNLLDASKIGDSPLAHIAQTCSLRMAKLLLDSGADPTLQIGLNRSAIERAKNRKRGDGPRVYELFCKVAGRIP
jgi:ankyrin repeat protein